VCKRRRTAPTAALAAERPTRVADEAPDWRPDASLFRSLLGCPLANTARGVFAKFVSPLLMAHDIDRPTRRPKQRWCVSHTTRRTSLIDQGVPPTARHLLAKSAHTGQSARVSMRRLWAGRQPLQVSLLAGATLSAGVAVFATRSDSAELGDGPISFWAVLVPGLLIVVLPVSLIAYRLLRRNRSMDAPIAFVSLVAGVVVATFAPGNLFGVGLVAVTFSSLGFLYLVAWAQQRPLR